MWLILDFFIISACCNQTSHLILVVDRRVAVVQNLVVAVEVFLVA